jgi:hypothetical protein
MNRIVGSMVTMTSLELVDFINADRSVANAVLAHSDFMKKVPNVIGGVTENFPTPTRTHKTELTLMRAEGILPLQTLWQKCLKYYVWKIAFVFRTSIRTHIIEISPYHPEGNFSPSQRIQRSRLTS